MVCLSAPAVVCSQVFVAADAIPDVYVFSGSSGDDWQEVEWTCRNPGFLSLPQRVLTREIVLSDIPLNQGAASERFCLGDVCFLPGTESSPPFSMGAFEEILIKPNYRPAFTEGSVILKYCVHEADEPPSNGVCHQIEFVYSLDGYSPGCTAPYALNFDQEATVDDGSCVFNSDGQAYNDGYAQGFEDGQSQSLTCASDADQDGVISVADLLSLLSVFGEICD